MQKIAGIGDEADDGAEDDGYQTVARGFVDLIHWASMRRKGAAIKSQLN
jgi:hypothetical protein